MPDSNPAVPYSLNTPVPARRGSVSPRMVKCGKPSCPCAHDPKARHGPYNSFTRALKGRTQSRFLTDEEASVVRRQIERGQQFHNEVDAFWKLCEQEADKELDALKAASSEAAKKGGSKRRSKRSSRPPPSRKSKRS